MTKIIIYSYSYLYFAALDAVDSKINTPRISDYMMFQNIFCELKIERGPAINCQVPSITCAPQVIQEWVFLGKRKKKR